MSFRTLVLCAIIYGSFALVNRATAQTSESLRPIAQQIASSKLNHNFSRVDILTPYEPSAERLMQANAFATDVTFSTIDAGILTSLYNEERDAMSLAIPYKNEVLELELVQVNILATGFKVTSALNGQQPYTPGVYYRGIIKGDPNSIVAISIFDNELFGVASSPTEGNINIGRNRKAGAAENEYLVYSDKDILVDYENSGCATPEPEGYEATFQELLHAEGSTRIEKCPKVYLEADYDLYVNKGSVTATSNYLTAIFNNAATIYANESVPIEISEIFVWDTNDGYSSASSFSALTDFRNNRAAFNGDIAHLIALDPGGLGGVAYTINGLCNTYKYCYSDVNSTYSDFPTYSWTVMVITHEMGHLFGSYHTHSCNWVGGALDNCYYTEGGCPAGPAPTDGGTIMSYCHLTAYGINFSNGFGEQPGDIIRNTISAAACIEEGGGEPGPAYCASLGSNSTYEWIESVSIQDLNNVTDNNFGYADFTDLTAILTPGESANFTLTPGYISDLAYTEYFSIWIDYNNDLDFSDAGENVYNSDAVTGPVSSSFLVPETASGETRMRISMKYAALPGACEIFTYGEVEDYTVSFSGEGSDYCDAQGIDASSEWIDMVRFLSFRRNSGSDNGYYDGTTDYTMEMMAGETYGVKYSAGFAGSSADEYYKAWIDYNRDGDFDDSGEELFSRISSSSNRLKNFFTVPESAAPGKTRFRIAMKNGSYPGACETFANGEVEDYSIDLLPGLKAGLLSEVTGFEVYPNPNNGSFQFAIANSDDATVSVNVFDMTGKLVYASVAKSANGLMTIDCGDITPGLYMLRIYSQQGQCIATTKFIKE